MKKLLLIPLILAIAAPLMAQNIPTHQGWLTDEANLLSPSEEAQLRSRSHIGDYQVCILTMPSTMGSEPKDVAVNTLNTWNPGPNSVLILVSLNPRKLYLQPGTSLKNVFTDEVASRICREVIKPHLSQGRNFQGLQAGVDAIRLTIYPVEASVARADSSALSIFLWSLGGGGLLFVIAVILAKMGVYPFSSAPEPYRREYKDEYTKHSVTPSPAVPVIFPTPSMPAKSELPRLASEVAAPKKVTKKAGKKTSPYRSSGGSSSKPAKPASSTPYEPSSSYEAPSSSHDSSYEPYKYDSSPSSFDSSSSFSCDSGGGGGSDF